MRFILEFIASFCAAIFAGASLYINLVEHPARMECGTALAVAEFAPSYRRATVMQASLALLGSGAGIFASLLQAGLVWLVAGLLLGAVVPFTLIAIFPTNKKLLDSSLNRNSESAQRLLRQWARLHAVRTLLSLLALVILLWAGAMARERNQAHARETSLRQDLFTLRAIISQYTLDKQEAPHSLDDLVKAGYVKSIPVNPCTGRIDWKPMMQDSPPPGRAPGIVDLDSAALNESACSN